MTMVLALEYMVRSGESEQLTVDGDSPATPAAKEQIQMKNLAH
jgi:hypothetical protein